MHLKYNERQAGLGQAERCLIDSMVRLGKSTIVAQDLMDNLAYSKARANLMLSRLCQKGWLQRLKAGVYRIIPLGSDTANPVVDDPWATAMDIFSPCYISGWTASEHWDLTEQIFNSTVIFTGLKLRKKEHLVGGVVYRTKFISENNIFGTKKIWSSNKPILIADMHRLIIDILDDPQTGGGGRHTIDIVKAYWQNKEADPEILWQYAERLGHGAVFKRLGLVAEKIMHLPASYLDRIHEKIKTGIINLDPSGIDNGPIITKWGIRVNIPSGDIL